MSYNNERKPANWIKSVTVEHHTLSFSDKGYCKFTRRTLEGKEQIVCMFPGVSLVEFIQAAEVFTKGEELYRTEIAPAKERTKAETYAKLQAVKQLDRQIQTVQASLDALKTAGLGESDPSVLTLTTSITALITAKAKLAA